MTKQTNTYKTKVTSPKARAVQQNCHNIIKSKKLGQEYPICNRIQIHEEYNKFMVEIILSQGLKAYLKAHTIND